MAKDRHVARNLVIQVRTGETVGNRITDLSEKWKVAPNEAARRLLILAAYGLTHFHYAVVERLANTLGGGSAFLRACDQALAALDSSDHTRRLRGEAPMSEQERVFYLEGWVDELVNAGKEKHLRNIKKQDKDKNQQPEQGSCQK